MNNNQYKILFVDDEPNILSAYKRHLRNDYQVEIAKSGKAALALISEHSNFAAIISDMQMSEMNGIQFLQEVRTRSPESVRIMLTGKLDDAIAARAVNESNIFRFLYKPCSTEDLSIAVHDAVEQYKLITAERDLLQNTLSGSVKLLTDILALVSPTSFGQSVSLRELIRSVSSELGVSNSWSIELASMLGEIGSIALPEQIITKAHQNAALSEDEQQLLANVPLTSERLISNIPRLQPVALIVRYLHKNFDGSGFPVDNLEGEKIPIGARIIQTVRAYKEHEMRCGSAFASLEALASSRKFDPRVVEALRTLTLKANAAKTADQPAVFEISVSQLCIGQRLLEDVQTSDGVLLISAGHEVTALILERIGNYASAVGVRQPLKVDALIPTVNSNNGRAI
ncbi:MAG: response regulator [Bdellovibrionales bacterium]|nr:response regulator [Bdellovibrionales bacterium]